MVQRGLLLLALMSALAVTVLVFLNLGGVIDLFGKREPISSQVPSERPEWLVASLFPVAAGYPGTVNWQGTGSFGQALPSMPGWEVRYNAAATLARRGSSKVPLDVLAEMLDAGQQLRNFRTRREDGQIVANEGEAANAVLIALKAFQEWQKHPKAVQALANDPRLDQVNRAVDELTRSPQRVLSTRAREVQLSLKKEP